MVAFNVSTIDNPNTNSKTGSIAFIDPTVPDYQTLANRNQRRM